VLVPPFCIPADTDVIPFSELELMEVVGAGHSGSLYRARWRREIVAVKTVSPPVWLERELTGQAVSCLRVVGRCGSRRRTWRDF
jgi:hypothetical protein